MQTQEKLPLGNRLLWLLALWLGGFGAVFALACVIRGAMHLAGMTS
jgi:hypothetical protein